MTPRAHPRLSGHYKNPKAKSKAQQALLASAEVTARNSTTRQRLDRNSIREFQGENRKACPTFPKSILYFWAYETKILEFTCKYIILYLNTNYAPLTLIINVLIDCTITPHKTCTCTGRFLVIRNEWIRTMRCEWWCFRIFICIEELQREGFCFQRDNFPLVISSSSTLHGAVTVKNSSRYGTTWEQSWKARGHRCVLGRWMPLLTQVSK